MILHTSLHPDAYIKMTAYFYYGVLLKRQGDFSSAVPYLLDSLNYFNQEQIEDRYCETLYEIATLYAEYDRKRRFHTYTSCSNSLVFNQTVYI
ncbi:hypothetical protein OE903_11365 [Bacillus sp. B6(2022)]|nr:hypothetical protein [Bacillus sp. B6(2022)]